ncbi:MAG: AmmeMemoRadiSam system radical SAM enzyme [bacterium]|nr:MAG: AmmeMemoRadiSam system radical SAM enzyme [bacterium]
MMNHFHKAILWEPLPGNAVRCNACAHRCGITDGRFGVCGTRKNIGGKLFTNVYERPIAEHTDPIEKKPLFHFLPGSKAMSIGTAGCNFKCSFCQNYDISQMRGNDTKGEDLSISRLLDTAETYGCSSIAYTYNEPVVFIEYVLDAAKEAHKRGLKNVYISNGYETEETFKLLPDTIDAMNIDLKAYTEKFYRTLCKGRLEPVLENIRRAYETGIWVEVTTLLIPGENDSEEEMRDIASFIASVSKDIPWHISRFFPTYKMRNVPPTSLTKLERARETGIEEGLHFVYTGNVPHESNTTFCPQCGDKLIVRSAYTLSMMRVENGRCPHCRSKIPGVF